MCFNPLRGKLAAALCIAEASDRLPGGEPWQPLRLLRVGSRQRQAFAGHVDRRQERHRGRYAAKLFGDDCKVQKAEPDAAIVLGDDCGGPAHIHDLRPQVVGRLHLSVQAAPHQIGRAVFGEKPARFFADGLLLVGKFEIHAGAPS
jgi:hypothetical protein